MQSQSEPEPLSPILPLYSSPPSSPPPQPPPSTTSTTPLPVNKKNSQQGTHWKSDTKNFRIQGWDPMLIIAQILALQALHYLVLSVIVPPMLYFCSDPVRLEYEGGTRNVAMIVDWRAMVGRSTLHLHNKDLSYQINHPIAGLAGFGKLPKSLGRKPFRIGNRLPALHVDSGHSNNNSSSNLTNGLVDKIQLGLGDDWIHHHLNDSNLNALLFYDANRSWVISSAWFITSMVGVIMLYEIVRRPKHIMDHSMTISLIHLILTTYYSAQLPTSLWFYLVLIVSNIVQIVLAEQLCVRREFRDGLGVGWKVDHRPDDD